VDLGQDELLQMGARQIDETLAWLHGLGIPYRTGRALDFGCRAGQFTQGLARTFTQCDGVDFEPKTIERADEINRFGDRCRFHVNDRDDLALFDDGVFDLVYSDTALQRIAPEQSAVYIHEFTRIVAPGGVAVFQLPSHPLPADDSDADDAPETRPANEIHGVRRANVEAILLAGAVELVVVKESDRAPGWSDYWYVGVKRDAPVKPRRRLRDLLRRR
jgi:SAM-dependent methyltransferase